jgi:hypothetical protein
LSQRSAIPGNAVQIPPDEVGRKPSGKRLTSTLTKVHFDQRYRADADGRGALRKLTKEYHMIKEMKIEEIETTSGGCFCVPPIIIPPAVVIAVVKYLAERVAASENSVAAE